MALGAQACLPAQPSVRDDLDALRRSAEAHPTDVDVVARAAAVSWARDDVAGAQRILDEARRRHPGILEYAVLLGVIGESAGAYEAAGEQYRAFLQSGAASELADSVALRLHLLRTPMASATAQRIAQGTYAVEMPDPLNAVVLPVFRAPPSDEDLVALAHVGTEVAMLELRRRGLDVVDWSLSNALFQLSTETNVRRAANEVSRGLGALRVAVVELERGAGGQIQASISSGLFGGSAPDSWSTTSFEVDGADPQNGLRLLSFHIWERVIGAPPGSALDVFTPDDPATAPETQKPAAPPRAAWCRPAIGTNARFASPCMTASTAASVVPTTEDAASKIPGTAGVSPVSRKPRPVLDFCDTRSM